jgi:hypothetical protein
MRIFQKNIFKSMKTKYYNHYSLKALIYLIILFLNQNVYPTNSQLIGSEKTMEQFLDRLLHESVYDRRIRPFYTDGKSNYI